VKNQPEALVEAEPHSGSAGIFRKDALRIQFRPRGTVIADRSQTCVAGDEDPNDKSRGSFMPGSGAAQVSHRKVPSELLDGVPKGISRF